MYTVPSEGRIRHQIPRKCSFSQLLAASGCRDANPGPLREQPTILIISPASSKIIFIWLYCICLFRVYDMWVYVDTHWSQKRVLDYLGLDLQEVVSHPAWALGTILGSSSKAQTLLSIDPSLQSQVCTLLSEMFIFTHFRSKNHILRLIQYDWGRASWQHVNFISFRTHPKWRPVTQIIPYSGIYIPFVELGYPTFGLKFTCHFNKNVEKTRMAHFWISEN